MTDMSELNPFDREALKQLDTATDNLIRNTEARLAWARGEVAPSVPPETARSLAPLWAVMVALALLVLAIAVTGLDGTAPDGVVTPPLPVPSPSPGVPVPAPGQML